MPFNPTMVWFYRKHLTESFICEKTFQSHYGLILSRDESNRIQYLTFNPTMVWFYQNEYDRITTDLTYPFNPTMVWFYRNANDNLHARRTSGFQSHYGLILSKRLLRMLEIHRRTFNPTMVWFYHMIAFDDELLYIDLSIPLWSDFIVLLLCVKRDFSHALSIPLWSDFIMGLWQCMQA